MSATKSLINHLEFNYVCVFLTTFFNSNFNYHILIFTDCHDIIIYKCDYVHGLQNFWKFNNKINVLTHSYFGGRGSIDYEDLINGYMLRYGFFVWKVFKSKEIIFHDASLELTLPIDMRFVMWKWNSQMEFIKWNHNFIANWILSNNIFMIFLEKLRAKH